jgi:PilZ domain
LEHRHHVRVPVGCKTLIYRRGVPIATGRIRDASAGGLFIETECSELRMHLRVECELHAGEGCGAIPRRVSVCVVRQSPEGAGVELDEDHVHVASAMLAFVSRSGGIPGAG